MFSRQTIAKTDGAGNYKLKGGSVSPYYKAAVEDYLNLWVELFDKALEKDEFQYILSLLRFRGIQSQGWDKFETTIDAFKGVNRWMYKVDGTTRLNMNLWLYGHVVEANEHYEIIANMVRVAGGDPYRAWNFPPIKTRRGNREQTPNEKIIEIKKLCDSYGFEDYSRPFKEVLNKELRNAIYHSDYAIYGGAVRYKDSNNFDVELSEQQLLAILNRSLALHTVIRNLINTGVAAYTEPRLIKSGPHFTSGGPELDMQIIIRKKRGLIAVHEIPQGPGAVSLGIYKPGEQEKIAAGQFILPASLNDEINKIAWELPPPLSKLLIRIYKLLEKIGWIRAV